MKQFIILLTFFVTVIYAHQYEIYDMNGKNRGTYNGTLSKYTITRIAKEIHGSILVKKNATSALKTKLNSYLNSASIKAIQKNIELSQDSLGKEFWLEIEKNETVKICLDHKIFAWETSLSSAIYNDSCLAFQAPMYIGVDTIKVYFSNENAPRKINLAIGMKYLNFRNEKVKLGYNDYTEEEKFLYGIQNDDPERFVSFTGTFLVDKYPVTNCEIMQLMWDSIPMKTSIKEPTLQKLAEQWANRKKFSTRNENCAAHDSATSTFFVIQAMKYANARSTREGLKPYYKFKETNEREPAILSRGLYVIGYYDYFNLYGKSKIQVSIDSTSKGYRLPYYDEWMMLARGGDKKNRYSWGDDSASFDDALKYARFYHYEKFYDTDHVGLLLPNGYGLYDMFGLVEEHVLFEEVNPFIGHDGGPSCMKGGNVRVTKEFQENPARSYWKQINYGYKRSNNNSAMPGGFRLIRNIGNKTKWTEVKSDKE